MTCKVYLKKRHWVDVTVELQKLRNWNILRNTCTLLHSQTFTMTWFVLCFRKIDTKLGFSATSILHLSLSTAGRFGGYLLSIFNYKMNCLLSESIKFHRPSSMAMKLRQIGWETFQHLKSTWLHAQAAQTDHTCRQEQVCYEAWWICSNNNRDGKGIRKLPRNQFWGDWHMRLRLYGCWNVFNIIRICMEKIAGLHAMWSGTFFHCYTYTVFSQLFKPQ